MKNSFRKITFLLFFASLFMFCKKDNTSETDTTSVTLTMDSQDYTVNFNADTKEAIIVLPEGTNVPAKATLKTLAIPHGAFSYAVAGESITLSNSTATIVVITAGGTSTSYAIKVKTKYVVSFNSNGGPFVAAQTITSGDKATQPNVPQYVPYTFAGWYKDKALTRVFNFATETITTDMTLYAKWNLDWVQATDKAAFRPRNSHTSAVFHNKIWVIAGNATPLTNDVWYSSDGVTWNQATANAAFDVRYGHSTVIFNDKLWVIGGAGNNRAYYNDVWSSSDGVKWTQVTDKAQFSVRNYHTSVVFNNKIWVIGGFNNGSFKNDIWYSSDGINWTEVKTINPFSARFGHTSVVFNNKIWVIGGYDISAGKNDVWSSPDGVTWTKVTDKTQFDIRGFHTSVVFHNKIWVIAGFNSASSSSPDKNDVWSSDDGITWTQETTRGTIFGTRQNHTSVICNDKIWVIGGVDLSVFRNNNDVWRTK